MERAPRTRRQRKATASGHARRHAFAIAAGLLALAALGVLALAPKPTLQVPKIDGAQSGVALRFAFAFPDDDDPPLERPVGVVAAGDRVYVVDSSAGVVRVYDDRGVERGVIGAGTLGVPVYAAVDVERGVLYVTDRAKGALFLFGLEDGALVGTLTPSGSEGSTITTAWAPLALCVAETGALVVSDVLSRHRVLLLEPDGTIVREIGGVASAVEATGVAVVLDYPNGVLAVGDEIWVSDSSNKRVLVFGRDGSFSRVISTSGLARGFDLVPPLAGTTETTLVALVDALGGDIAIIDTAGAPMGRFGGPGTTAGRLAFPNDVSVDAERGRVYVADTGNRRVQAWDLLPAADGGAALPGLAALGNAGPHRWIAAVAGLLAVVMAVGALLPRSPSRGTRGAAVYSE